MSERHGWVFILALGFGAGVALRSAFDISGLLLAALASAALLFCVAYLMRRSPALFLTALLLISVSLGALRTDLALRAPLDTALVSQIGEAVVVQGVVTEEPDERENRLFLTVRLDRLGDEAVDGVALITADLFTDARYGDRVELRGVLKFPENFETSSGRTFNYVGYLAKDGIRYRMLYPGVEVISGGEGNPLRFALISVKRFFLERVNRVIAEPEASLLAGLLVGAKQSLGEELLDAFRTSGLVHIVVLSGYNLTIVADAVMRVLSFLPLYAASSLGGVTIVLFALMTGASATVVRASIMALLVLLARATGRVYDVLRALFIAAFFMLLYNPLLLSFDPSFQLSFLATLGLLLLTPLLEQRLLWITPRAGLRTIVSATVSTQLFVLPLLLYQTGTISVVGLLANLLVLPLVPATMFVGFLAGLFSSVHATLAMPAALLSTLMLSYELWIAETFAALPFSSVSMEKVSPWIVVSLYALGGSFLIRHYGRALMRALSENALRSRPN